MCSKKCAKPDLPGSTSLREPVCTGICSETIFGKPVGTTITLRPFGSVFSLAVKGSRSAFLTAPSAVAGVAACAEADGNSTDAVMAIAETGAEINLNKEVSFVSSVSLVTSPSCEG